MDSPFPRWPPGHAVRTSEQEQQSLERLVAAVNAVPVEQWLSELRSEQQRRIGSAQAALQEAEDALAIAQASVRRAQCHAVAAELAATQAGRVAFKLLDGGWPCSAEQLRETVGAVLSPPACSPGS